MQLFFLVHANLLLKFHDFCESVKKWALRSPFHHNFISTCDSLIAIGEEDLLPKLLNPTDSKHSEKSCECGCYFLILVVKKLIRYLINYNLVFFHLEIVSSHYFTWINRLKLLKVVT